MPVTLVSQMKKQIDDLSTEGKIAVLFRSAEVISETEDEDVANGLKALFNTLVSDLLSSGHDKKH